MRSVDINLVASSARDLLLNKQGDLLEVREGGPAFFLRNAFNIEGINFDEYTLPKLDVEILTGDGEEKGRIRNNQASAKVDFARLNASVVVISTIVNNIFFVNVDKYQGDVYMDVQGFVRNPSLFGGKQIYKIPEVLLDKITCLKATKLELQYLDPVDVKRLESRMLLVTTGKRGSLLYLNGEKYGVQAQAVPGIQETIGAGDTLFGFFIGSVLKGINPTVALEGATKKVGTFLLEKQLSAKIGS